MIKIYGSPRSSSGRCFWCLEEAGVDYQVQPINFKEKEHKSEEYLAINPNGKVPSLVDDDYVLWESMAINFYLAEAYKPELLGQSPKEKGLAHQWSFWSINDLQSPLIDVFIQLVFVPEEKRNSEAIEKAQAKIPGLLTTLDNELKDKKYLVGDTFTIADLNVASVVHICHEIKYDLSKYSHINSWLKAIADRPAFQKYQALRN